MNAHGTLVDANVLIDLSTADAGWGAWAGGAVRAAADHGPLVVNPIIYAELAADYATAEELDRALPRNLYERRALPWEAAHLAGRAFLRYRRSGGARRSPLPDFYIGAHAQVEGLRLLTRDAGRYRAYFPAVALIAPEGAGAG